MTKSAGKDKAGNEPHVFTEQDRIAAAEQALKRLQARGQLKAREEAQKRVRERAARTAAYA